MPPRLSSIPCSSSLHFRKHPPPPPLLSRRMRNRPRRRGSGSLSASEPLDPSPPPPPKSAGHLLITMCGPIASAREGIYGSPGLKCVFYGARLAAEGQPLSRLLQPLARGISRPGISVTLIKTEHRFSRRKAQFGRVLRVFPQRQPPLFTVTASSGVLLSWFHD